MKTPKKATIFFNGIPAGVLEKSGGVYTFNYFDEYLLNPANPAISLSLPKQREVFRSKILFPFFFGLLSEGENRDIICKTKKIDRKDYLSLLLSSAEYDTIGPITVRV